MLRNNSNAETAIEAGLSEEQVNTIIDLCALRHDFHCNIDGVADNDQDTHYKRRIVELNVRLNDFGLPTISGVPTIPEDYIDIDDLYERIELARFDGTYPSGSEYNEWVEDNRSEIQEQLYALHKSMEDCLDEIDKKYNTNFAPTGAQRIL